MAKQHSTKSQGRSLNKLTSTEVKAAKGKDKVFTLADGGGLGLVVKPSGGRYWQFRYRDAGRAAVASFGTFPDVSLAHARRKAEQARTDLSNLITPKDRARMDEQQLAEERRLHGNTFKSIAQEWYDYTCSLTGENEQWTNTKHRAQIISTLKKWAFPKIGSLPIGDVKTKDIRKVIDAIKNEGLFETATRTFQRIGMVFDAAVEDEIIDSNPCDVLRRNKRFMKRPAATNLPALSPDELPELVKAIDKADIKPMTKLAVRLSLLTALRPGEIRHGEWSEIDWEAREWSIPGKKMKAGRDHVIPLSDQALEVLHDLEALTGRNRFLFPHRSKGNTGMSDGTVNMAIKRMGFAGRCTAHGFRSIFSTWANATKVHRKDPIEMQLAHAGGSKVRGAYNRHDYIEERAQLMQGWANLITEAGIDNVTSIQKGNGRDYQNRV
jgi:integrase